MKQIITLLLALNLYAYSMPNPKQECIGGFMYEVIYTKEGIVVKKIIKKDTKPVGCDK